jgi:hypothetical protein
VGVGAGENVGRGVGVDSGVGVGFGTGEGVDSGACVDVGIGTGEGVLGSELGVGVLIAVCSVARDISLISGVSLFSSPVSAMFKLKFIYNSISEIINVIARLYFFIIPPAKPQGF